MSALPYPAPPLADDVVRLRPWGEPDIGALVRGLREPAVDRFFWARGTAYSPKDARWFIDTREAVRREGSSLHLAVVEPRTGEVLGGVLLKEVSGDRSRAEVGYWVMASVRRRGIATRAVRLLVDWSRNGLGIKRLALTCDLNNIASQGVAERCGFVRVGERSADDYVGEGQPRAQLVFELA
jgi:RimJ/RimL family protein N-acetyltransferase